MKDGHAVARSSDFIIYSVEAEFIEKVVAEYGPCTLYDTFLFASCLIHMSAFKPPRCMLSLRGKLR